MADGLGEFQEHRSRMFGIAYQMLGSVTDAEEILQEAWLRWQGVDHSQVKDPAAFLARTRPRAGRPAAVGSCCRRSP